MNHALIIEDNLIIGNLIEERLAGIGFETFDHAWTEQQVIDFVARRRPDLIVLGDEAGSRFGHAAVRKINKNGGIAVLQATADGLRTRKSIGDGTSMHGPYRIDEIGTATIMALVAAGSSSPSKNAA
jgi:DNA-binding response OmpR family regulator